MKKLFNILFVIASILFMLIIRQDSFADTAPRMLVVPVDVPTVQSSYGVYPNTVDMVANNLINSLNVNSEFEVPDINTSRDLIESYGLSKDYNKLLMNYRDNRVLDYKTCGKIHDRLGVNKILLVDAAYDVQNAFLGKSPGGKYSVVTSAVLPFLRIFSKDLVFMSMPFIGGHIYNTYKNDEPVKAYYKLNVNLSVVDTDTGLVSWDKTFSQEIPASDFGIPGNSFGENILPSEKLKVFSQKIAEKILNDTTFISSVSENNSEYTSVRSIIIPSSGQTKTTNINNKAFSKDGKMTRDGQSFSSNDKYLENVRKQSYKSWVKQQAKN